MSTKNKKAGAGKFLALLASLSMVIAGLTAIAFASPASAGDKVWICHSDADNNDDGGLGGGTGGEFQEGYNLIEVSVNAWNSSHNPATAIGPDDEPRHPHDKLADAKNGGWTCDGEEIVCDDKNEELVDGECVVVDPCDEVNDQSGSVSYKDDVKDEDPCIDPCDDDQSDSVSYKDDIKTDDPCIDPCDDTAAAVSYKDGNENEYWDTCPNDPTGDVSLNCDGAWAASVDIPGEDSVDVQVVLDDETVIVSDEDVDGEWSDSGNIPDFVPGEHTISVQYRHGNGTWKTLDSDSVDCAGPPAASATCSTLTVVVNDAFWQDIWATQETGDSEPVQLEGSFNEDTNTWTFPLDGTVSKVVKVYNGDTYKPFDAFELGACEPTPECVDAPGQCSPPPTCENNPAACPPGDTPPAVAAAVVETPAAPAEVAAPAAATVANPAAATVAVPAAATLPASVPAGGNAPGMPLWALALVAVGIIGAAATGKQLLGARK